MENKIDKELPITKSGCIYDHFLKFFKYYNLRHLETINSFIHSFKIYSITKHIKKTVLYTNKYNLAIKETANGPYPGSSSQAATLHCYNI